MKARPRSVEREVAARLSSHFVNLGMSPVERIPVLGRTGPDISINESKLAADVKSRKCVPMTFAPCKGEIRESLFDLLAVRMADFQLLYSDIERSGSLLLPSVQVKDWFDHMREWADKHDAIPALVLHRPGQRIDNAVFVISAGDRHKLKEIYKQWREEHFKS